MLWLYVLMVRLVIRGLFNKSFIKSNCLVSNDKWPLANKLKSVWKEVVLC
jgi:hypothetical protein